MLTYLFIYLFIASPSRGCEDGVKRWSGGVGAAMRSEGPGEPERSEGTIAAGRPDGGIRWGNA